MSSNTQVNEDYKFRISYVFNFLKDMVSASGEIEDKELLARIEEVKNKQDSKHITNLEKDVETHDISKKRKTNRNASKEAKKNNSVTEKINLINNEVIQDEEKEL